jgi:hypothetical protein
MTDKPRYRLEKLEGLSQKIWDDLFSRELVSFSEHDYTSDFNPLTPELMTRFLNRDKTLDIYDACSVILSILVLFKQKNVLYDTMYETIEGLKEGGSAINFCLPEPHLEKEECVTTSELYRIQYRMCKQKWEAYHSRFYLKKPSKHDEVINRSFRSDLHHMRYCDGRWHFRCTVNGVTHKRFLSCNEDQAKLMRDKLMSELGFK